MNCSLPNDGEISYRIGAAGLGGVTSATAALSVKSDFTAGALTKTLSAPATDNRLGKSGHQGFSVS